MYMCAIEAEARRMAGWWAGRTTETEADYIAWLMLMQQLWV